MSQPTDASNEGEVMPNKPDNAVETTATDGRANAVTGDGASDQHASDAERAEVEALNARVAQLTEEVEHLSAALSWARAAEERMRHANAALAGTGTDWLEARLAQERERCAATAPTWGPFAVEVEQRITDVSTPESRAYELGVQDHRRAIRALGSADAPGGEKEEKNA